MLQLPQVTLLTIDTTHEWQKSFDAIQRSVQGIRFGEIRMLLQGVLPNLRSYDDYNKFCIRDLHGYFTTDFVLLIQADGFVLNPDKWRNEWLEYDYIGAPWSERDPRGRPWPHARVGNGGFSLRSKRFCETAKELPEEFCSWREEDQNLCREGRTWMEENRIRFAPIEEAELFSWEYNDSFPQYNKTFGWHGHESELYLKGLHII